MRNTFGVYDSCRTRARSQRADHSSILIGIERDRSVVMISRNPQNPKISKAAPCFIHRDRTRIFTRARVRECTLCRARIVALPLNSATSLFNGHAENASVTRDKITSARE